MHKVGQPAPRHGRVYVLETPGLSWSTPGQITWQMALVLTHKLLSIPPSALLHQMDQRPHHERWGATHWTPPATPHMRPVRPGCGSGCPLWAGSLNDALPSNHFSRRAEVNGTGDPAETSECHSHPEDLKCLTHCEGSPFGRRDISTLSPGHLDMPLHRVYGESSG